MPNAPTLMIRKNLQCLPAEALQRFEGLSPASRMLGQLKIKWVG